jgi:transposase-like protein
MTKKIKTKMDEAIDLLFSLDFDPKSLFEKDGLVKQLVKRMTERALQSEMEEHLGYERHERAQSGNSRNGLVRKTLLSEHGPIEIEVPRDREGSFEPILVPKRQRRIPGLDEKILSLYAKGMSLSDIKIQLEELYEAQVSESFISRVTEDVMDDVVAWQNRPLESIYPIVYFDAMVVKVRQDKKIINKAVYVALGINMEGHKDILGLWMSENEGSKFWLANLTELKNRGLKDILIGCSDNLTGMSDAIKAVYPNTDHQLCIVHQIRNSLKYVSYKDRKAVAADLKPVYSATSEEEALFRLKEFKEKWDPKYPQISKSWDANWGNLVCFLEYPEEIRRIIYTTNAIESVNSQFRKVTKNKRIFPGDNSVFKTLYLTIEYITRKWTMPIKDWNVAMAHFMIKFEGRI